MAAPLVQRCGESGNQLGIPHLNLFFSLDKKLVLNKTKIRLLLFLQLKKKGIKRTAFLSHFLPTPSLSAISYIYTTLLTFTSKLQPRTPLTPRQNNTPFFFTSSSRRRSSSRETPLPPSIAFLMPPWRAKELIQVKHARFRLSFIRVESPRLVSSLSAFSAAAAVFLASLSFSPCTARRAF